jgi:integrase/recombinase XerC
MRTAKPYFKTSHKCWYLRLDGRDIRLDTDEQKAQDEYFKIMAERTNEPLEHDLTSESATVRELLVAFLEWSKVNDTKGNHRYYLQYLTGKRGFGAYVSPSLRIRELRNFHVTGYLQKHHAKHHAGSIVPALKRPFNWAIKEGYIQFNPIQGVKRPATIGRAGNDSAYVSPAEFDTLVANIRSDEFRDYVEFMYETGCRAEEINKLLSVWFKPKQRCCIVPANESKGNKSRRRPKDRFIRLNDRALDIAKRNAMKNHGGTLFRNSVGNAWTSGLIQERFGRKHLTDAVGRKIVATYFRHTFISDALMFGLKPIEVVKLVGHDSLEMIMRYYEHVENVEVDAKFMQRMEARFNFGTASKPHAHAG